MTSYSSSIFFFLCFFVLFVVSSQSPHYIDSFDHVIELDPLVELTITDEMNPFEVLLRDPLSQSNKLMIKPRSNGVRQVSLPFLIRCQDCQHTRLLSVRSGQSLTFDSITFQGFVANDTVGGGVFHLEPGSSLTLTNCHFVNNSARPTLANGGVIYADSALLTIQDCFFSGNSATYGGVFFFTGSTVASVIRSQFFNNSATRGGGCIADGGNATQSYVDSYFDANFAQLQGGVQSSGLTAPAPIEFRRCTFTKNTAGSSSGALEILGHSQLLLVDCFFEANDAISFGVGQFNDPTVFSVRGCTFVNHTTSNSGGALGFGGQGEIVDSVFESNFSPDAGGAFRIITPKNILISDCIFRNNTASAGGAFSFLSSAANVHLTVHNCSFLWNTATVNGGANFFLAGSNVTLSDCIYQGNEAQMGGALHILSSHVQLTGSTPRPFLALNNMAYNGGAIAMTARSEMVFRPLSPCAQVINLTNNLAENFGGAIYLTDGSSVDLQCGIISSNMATEGAGFFFDQSSTFTCSTFQGLTLQQNVAMQAGGGSFFQSNQAMNCSMLKAISSASDRNVASYGPAIASLPFKLLPLHPVPRLLRSAQQFDLSFHLIDIFGAPIINAQSLFMFDLFLITDTPDVNLLGLTESTARDADALVSFRHLSIVAATSSPHTTAISLILQMSPALLPPQLYHLQLESCDGDYFLLEDQDFSTCVEITQVSSWAIILMAVLNSFALVLVLAMVLFYFVVYPRIQSHKPMPLHHNSCQFFGAILILISIYLWLDITDGTCMALVWLAAIGFVFLYGASLAALISLIRFDKSAVQQLPPRFERSRRDALILSGILSIFLGANLIVLIVWSVVDPYLAKETIDLSAQTVTKLCECNSPVYIWIIIGINLFLLCSTCVACFFNRKLEYGLRESKLFQFSMYHTLLLAIILIPIAVVVFDTLTAFFLIVTVGLLITTLVVVIALIRVPFFEMLRQRAGYFASDVRQLELEMQMLERERATLEGTVFISGLTPELRSIDQEVSHSVSK